MTSQLQTNASFFKMPMEIQVTFQDNSDTLVTVMNDENGQDFSWLFHKQPVIVTFDPDNNIVLKVSSTDQGKVWTGEVSNNWNVSGNWSPAGVPVMDDVIIPSTSLNMPVVKDPGMSCGSMTIKKGARVGINPVEGLTINGFMIIAGETGP